MDPVPQDRCPRCAGPNRCALTLPEAERPARCWCVDREFSPELLQGLAPHACVCESCCDAFEQGEKGQRVGG